MTRTQIIKRYNKLVEEIENMEIYDGRNTVDQYQCGKCHSRIFTTYKDKGVTPFVIGCPVCGGSMQHNRTFSKDTCKTLEGNWHKSMVELIAEGVYVPEIDPEYQQRVNEGRRKLAELDGEAVDDDLPF